MVWGSSYSGGHVIAVAAQDPSLAAVISQGAAVDGLAALTGPSFRNEMRTRGVARIAFNRPVRLAGAVRCPTLLVIAEYDEIAPSSAVHEVARRLGPLAEVARFNCGHFALYAGEEFEASVTRQVAFLQRVLAR